MKQDLTPIDDGMIHESILAGNWMVALKNPLSHLIVSDPSEQHGYVAVEDGELKNEGGNIFGAKLAKFHGEIIII